MTNDNYYDKEGKPMEMLEWAKLLEDKNYQIIKQDTFKNGNFVSTVWLGLNYNFGKGKPLIFETMVFDTNKKEKFKIGKRKMESMGEELDVKRYATLEEAKRGHKKMIKKYS